MKRTRMLAAVGACVLTLGCAFTATPAASEPALAAGSEPAGSETAATVSSDPYIAAMQRDLGLTEAQARTRIHQEAVAMAVDAHARVAAGAAYGGSWFDAARGSLVVGLSEPGNAKAVRATGAEVVSVPRSLAELDAVKATLDGMKAPADVAGWRVDPKSGGIVVTVRRGGSATEFLAAARKLAPVTVERTDRMPTTFAAGTVGGDPYIINGSVRCSIGFSVQGGFVSAGHCGSAGASVNGWDGSWMGNFAASSFPGNDYSFIRIGGGWWTVPVVLGWGTVPDRLVRGSAVAPVGSSICRSGSTSHWHCGTVLGMNETVNYQQGAVYQMTHTNVCAEPGDSGGSYISGEQAQGMTSGGWGNCSSGGETWFQPV
ncbi:S1 family peptidase, partial [Actinophytocola sp.]|uniref:S1 family peptidase n=1 Tax=Actinophytocola sp. TaxID=1872138 RepID=UPI00389B1C5B